MYDPVERRNFYGRVHGKTLRQSQKTYLEEDLEKLSLPGVTREDNPDRAPIDLSRFDGKPLWLEIGFGGGEHLVTGSGLGLWALGAGAALACGPRCCIAAGAAQCRAASQMGP